MLLETEPRKKSGACRQRGVGSPAASLARAPALELHRHADGLVARRRQLRLSISRLTWAQDPQARRSDDAGRARRRSADGRRPGGAQLRATPGRLGDLPAVRARHPARHRRDGLGFLGGRDRGEERVAAGLLLASLGGGELALREHLAGFRSHSALLAGWPPSRS